MKQWRESGCVQDSDDDDDIPSQDVEINTNERGTERDQESQDATCIGSHANNLRNGETSSGVVDRVFNKAHLRDENHDRVSGHEAVEDDERHDGSQALRDTDHWAQNGFYNTALQEHMDFGAESVHSAPGEGSSIASSPLSRPLSPRSLNRLLEDIPDTDISGLSSRLRELSKDISSLHDANFGAEDGNDPLVDPSGRNLRRRKAEQLHPYAIELQRYRQTMMSRGVKPILISKLSIQQDKGNLDGESQNQVLQQDDSYLDQGSSQSSTKSSIQEQTRNRRHNLSSSVSPLAGNAEEEFPSLEALIHGDDHNTVRKRYKRLKTSHNSSRRNVDDMVRYNRLVETQPDTEDIYDIPMVFPTPTRRQDARLGIAAPRFRVPPGMASAQQNTPATSIASNMLSPHQTSCELGIESPRPTIPTRGSSRTASSPVILVDDEKIESLSDHFSSDSSVELRHARRKIRGVLPASWLKLDKQAQKSRKREEISNAVDQIRDNAQLQKGTAVKLFKPSSHALSWRLDINASSPNEIATSRSALNELKNLEMDLSPPWGHGSGLMDSLTHIDGHVDYMPDVDDMEDNSIDRMLPQRLHRDYAVRGQKYRHNRLTNIFQRHKILNTGGKRTATPRPSEIEQQTSSTKAEAEHHKLRTPCLSIFDTPCASATDVSSLPIFLRIALRQARSRSDLARQSPTRKFIRLQTAEDTMEANRVLEDWRERRIAQRQEKPNSGTSCVRHPLAERSRNQQKLVPDPVQVSAKEAAVQDIDDKIADIPLPRGKKIRTRQSTLTFLSSKIGPTQQNKASYLARLDKPKPHSVSRLNLPISVVYRTGALESLESQFYAQHRDIAFQKGLRRNDKSFIKLFSEIPKSSLHLDRILSDDDPLAVPTLSKGSKTIITCGNTRHTSGSSVTVFGRHQRRKRPTKRIDAETEVYRQSRDPPMTLFRSVSEYSKIPGSEVLTNLGSYGVHYSTNFNVRPLELGTHFHQSTFIGSGEFSRALSFNGRNLDTYAGVFRFETGEAMHEWSSWDEEVASEIAVIFRFLSLDVEGMIRLESNGADDAEAHKIFARTYARLRLIINYFSKNLHFLDPPDRHQFVQHLGNLLQSFLGILLSNWETGRTPNTFRVRLVNLLVVLVHQIGSVHQSSAVTDALTEVTVLARHAIGHLLRYLLSHGLADLLEFLDDNRRHAKREAGIVNAGAAVETAILLPFLLPQRALSLPSFWELFNSQLQTELDQICDVGRLEQIWHIIFAVLPLHEIDSSGTVRIGTRFDSSQEDWAAVRAILNRLFSLYPESAKLQNSALNGYIRTNLTRCFLLVQDWGWKRCESMLNIIFDFFAKRGLSPLQNEQSHGSPRYLESLERTPYLTVGPKDMSFHIFLKVLAVGLKKLQAVYPDRKLRNIAYRFVPNHGRIYRKDEEVRQKDIDALRNHHDLLCTLYSACPKGHRPKLSLLRDLVDHSTSHREACRINVRAWTILITFQLSLVDEVVNLEPFTAWYRDIMSQTIVVYRSARTEAEAQYERANVEGSHQIPLSLLHSTIDTNESRVLAILTDLSNGMKCAFKSTRDLKSMSFLLQNSGILDSLKLLDHKEQSVHNVIIETLAVLEEYCNIVTTCTAETNALSLRTSEESQDYGEFPEFDDVVEAGDVFSNNAESDYLQTALSELLSNFFGAEPSPAEDILQKTVNIWVSWVCHLCAKGDKQWHNFLDQYSAFSWSQLRDTYQTRKYRPYFMALLLESNSRCYIGHEGTFLSAWILSLVERESMLKFQHRFTTALLRIDPSNALLQNLPFLAHSYSKATLPLKELRERRLSVLSTVLSNIRTSYEYAKHSRGDAAELKREYASVLKQLMTAMKQNYLGLQRGGSVHGAYVTFVHKVVEFLQQYGTEICPIDKFFTDSSAFPLPANDPTYVVGRLRSYELKLAGPSSQKQLAIFIQTISERAAIDGQQEYLVSQLWAAIKGTVEKDDPQKPSLRCIFLCAIYPAYLRLSFKTSAGWIVAQPILQAAILMLRELPFVLNTSDDRNTSKILDILKAVLASARNTTHLLVDHSGLLEQPQVLQVVGLVFEALTALLPTLEFFVRHAASPEILMAEISYTKTWALFVAEILLDGTGIIDPNIYHEMAELKIGASAISAIQELASRELSRALEENWSTDGDYYFVQRGGVRREVTPCLESLDMERARAMDAVEKHLQVLQELLSNEADRKLRRMDGECWAIGELVL